MSCIEESKSRPSWDEYFLQMVDHVATRATCDRGRCGCVIVKDKRVLATGYVGSPPRLDHCDDVGHLMRKVVDEDGTIRQHCVRTIHAEQNAICQAARYGISVEGGTLYCKMEPCRVCAMLIIGCGLERVICRKRYHAGQDTREMFAKAGIDLVVLEDEIEQYTNQ